MHRGEISGSGNRSFETLANVDNPRRRIAEGPRRARRARRILATLITLDVTMMLTVTLALVLFTYRTKNVLLLAAHGVHLFTIMLGLVAIYHTFYSYDVLRWLMLGALVAMVFDLFVLMIRVIIIMQIAEDSDAMQYRMQYAYLAICLLFVIFVDIPLAYYADDLRDSVLLPNDESKRSTAPASHMFT